MKSRIAYYLFVLCLLVAAAGIAMHLNKVALINYNPVVNVLTGEDTLHLHTTPEFNNSVAKQIATAQANGADTALVNYFQKVSGKPSKLLVKLQELFIWHTVTNSQNHIEGGKFKFELQCNPAYPFKAIVTLGQKGEDYYLEEIVGLDSTLILVPRYFSTSTAINSATNLQP